MMSRKPESARPIALRAALLSGAAILVAGLPAVAGAAEAPNTVEEVVVTVRHREENLQKVPAAVSAVSGEFLEKANITGVAELVRLNPSVQFQVINPRNSQLNIRGLGNAVGLASDGLEPGVGFYVDGVYYSRPATASFDLIDLQNVQVLNGPQGTLYGKNTTAGAVSITTAAPSFDPGATLEATAGNFGFYQLKGSVTGAIVADKVAGRLSLSKTARDGYEVNLVDGKRINDYENLTVRGQILFTLSDDLRLRVIGDYSKQDTHCCSANLSGLWTPPSGANFTALSAQFGQTPRVGRVQVDAPVKANQTTGGVSAEATWNLPGAVLTSITAWRYWEWRPASDLLQTALDDVRQSAVDDDQEQFSQEFRIASTGENTFDYVAGVYLYHELLEARGVSEFGSAATASLVNRALPALILNGYRTDSVAKYNTTSYAAFGQLTWRATDALSLTGGLRYTHDAKRGTYDAVASGGAPLLGPLAPFAALRAALGSSKSFKTELDDGAWSGHLDAAYQINPDVMTYASYSRGNRSGGLNLNQLPANASPIIKAETIEALELGVKSRLFERRLTLNADVFYQTDRNYQANAVDPVLLRTYLANIPKVRSKGFEVSGQARLGEAFDAYGSLTYTKATSVSFPFAPCPVETPLPAPASCNFNGAELAGTPKWAGALGFEHHRTVNVLGGEAELYLGADANYRSAFSNEATNTIYGRLPSRTLVNARLGLRATANGWDAYLWGKNLGDVDFYTSTIPSPAGYISGFRGEPRTYGATLRLRY
jgi:iron complex outermembrane receptor protein